MKYLMLVVSIGYMVLVVALLIAGYQYRTDLLPFLYDNEPQPVAEQQAPATSTTATTSDHTSAPAATPAPAVTTPAPAVAAQPSRPVSPPAAAMQKQLPRATQAPQAPAQLAQRSYPAPAPRYAPSAPAYRHRPYAPSVAPQTQPSVKPNTATPRPVPRYAQPAAPKLTEEQQKTMKLTRKVQQAMWQRKFDDAIGAQKELIALHPKNPELIGQLGNMYFTQQKAKDAAAAYVQASEILIDRKQIGRAMQMLPVIMRLDEKSGSKLLQKLEKTLGRKLQPPMMHRQQHRSMPNK